MDAALPPLTASTLRLAPAPRFAFAIFPLTLALSLGERGQPMAFTVCLIDFSANPTLETIQAAETDSPSPQGRGPG